MQLTTLLLYYCSCYLAKNSGLTTLKRGTVCYSIILFYYPPTSMPDYPTLGQGTYCSSKSLHQLSKNFSQTAYFFLIVFFIDVLCLLLGETEQLSSVN